MNQPAPTPTPRTDTDTKITFTGAYTCTHHNDAERTACPVCLVASLTTERDQLRAEAERTDVIYQRACEVEHQLRAEVERLRSDRDCEKRLRKDAEELREDALERAEKSERAETVALAKWNGALERAMKAEADLVALAQCHDDNCRAVVKLDAELTAAKERLRSEAMDDYASIKDLQRELATERARLDWLDQQGAHYGWKVQLPTDYPNVKECVFVCRNTTSGHKTIREAIDTAMKKGAK